MAKRIKKITLSDAWKEKIKTSNIMWRLMAHVDGEVEMSNSQVNAAKILLSKVVPDLARTELAADKDNPLTININYPA